MRLEDWTTSQIDNLHLDVRSSWTSDSFSLFFSLSCQGNVYAQFHGSKWSTNGSNTILVALRDVASISPHPKRYKKKVICRTYLGVMTICKIPRHIMCIYVFMCVYIYIYIWYNIYIYAYMMYRISQITIWLSENRPAPNPWVNHHMVSHWGFTPIWYHTQNGNRFSLHSRT